MTLCSFLITVKDTAKNVLEHLQAIMHVNLKFGGKQPIIHDTQITNECLGMHAPKLQVGHSRNGFFQNTDKGPFYLSLVDRDLWHYDQIASRSTMKPKNMKNWKRICLQLVSACHLASSCIQPISICLHAKMEYQQWSKSKKSCKAGKESRKVFSRYSMSAGWLQSRIIKPWPWMVKKIHLQARSMNPHPSDIFLHNAPIFKMNWVHSKPWAKILGLWSTRHPSIMPN